mmetsp:Transcript_696/g.1691  ORF Transcript_696/g.1691 Transcript_696/m.1691 type:complete len:221 (-) Transcript_696:213-875(-)|eukprot:1152120-Pelagomonas_calceolata.AAC.2
MHCSRVTIRYATLCWSNPVGAPVAAGPSGGSSSCFSAPATQAQHRAQPPTQSLEWLLLGHGWRQKRGSRGHKCCSSGSGRRGLRLPHRRIALTYPRSSHHALMRHCSRGRRSPKGGIMLAGLLRLGAVGGLDNFDLLPVILRRQPQMLPLLLLLLLLLRVSCWLKLCWNAHALPLVQRTMGMVLGGQVLDVCICISWGEWGVRQEWGSGWQVRRGGWQVW